MASLKKKKVIKERQVKGSNFFIDNQLMAPNTAQLCGTKYSTTVLLKPGEST